MACGPPQFTKLSGTALRNSLAQRLIPTADRLRDLRVRFGLRPYLVRIIRTRWTGGSRGVGDEYVSAELELLPTPRISDLTAVAEIATPIGLDEVGSILLTEVSGRFQEEHLRGQDALGEEIAPDEQIFYEVEFPRLDGQPGERRRFFLRSAPVYMPDQFQWSLRLERAREGRSRSGELR